MKQIKDLLAMMDDESLSCGEMAQRAEGHLESVRARIEDLQRLEATLSGVLGECHRDDRPACPIVEALQDGGS